ncbi:MAG TPA: glycosyltransferase 87 family protein [bacterium]|nr:glycosyltransferase 87 family protein [bacterium]
MTAEAAPRPHNTRGPTAAAALPALGVLTAASYFYPVWAPIRDIFALRDLALVQTVLFVCAAWVVLRGWGSRKTLGLIVLVGILCRLPLMLLPPQFSDDVYRYIWDGRVQAAGVNPYRYIPADPALAGLRDAAIYPHINRRNYAPTIYPPVAEMIFLTVTRVSETVTAMKAGVVAFEGIAVWMLALTLGRLGLPRDRVLLYAWNPLVIWQYAGGGHVDAAAIAFVAVALLAHVRRWDVLTGVALGCAILVKWYPAFLFPALYRRGNWRMPAAAAATMIAGYVPYLGAGGGLVGFVPGYAREEGLLSGDRFFLLHVVRLAGANVPTLVYVAVALAVLLLIAFRALGEPDRTPAGDIRYAAMLATAFMVLISTHYLWYFGWLALFVVLAPTLPLLYLTGAATFLFSALWYRPFLGIDDEMLAFNIALYVPFALLALAPYLWPAVRRVRHRGARADGRGTAQGGM